MYPEQYLITITSSVSYDEPKKKSENQVGPKTSTGSVQSWPKGYSFVVFEISARANFLACVHSSS